MRVRFAPSPTGFLHIGNARTAIINYIIAKKHNAEYLLRVEDTDMERSSKESEESIIADLKWLGIEWTEGPDIDKGHGPYRQSERFEIYQKYTDKLLAEKKAYHCYCSQEELDAQRAESEAKGIPFTYKRTCLNLSEEKKKQYEAEGRKPTVRFKVNDGEKIEIDDGIKGKVVFESDNIGGDFIIVRSDGVPIYNYIVVIDDLLMEISHVIRGEDHLPNTPKQVMIARALDMPTPKYAHLPLVLGPDKKKLSKRHGITSVDLYKQEGYLPEALMNYIAVLGWSSETGEEILPLEEIIRQIDIDRLGKSSAVFDFVKLRWMNAAYIRNYDLKKITSLFKPFIEKAGYDLSKFSEDYIETIISSIRGNCELLSDIAKLFPIFADDIPSADEEASAMIASAEGKTALTAAKELVDSGEINSDNFTEITNMIKAKTGLKGKNLFMPVRAMLTSVLHGPDLAEMLKLIGFEKIKMRISSAYEKNCV